ncbi:MAG TPA: RDD family protein [Nitrospiraceae bacterium]|nr:RDD family protein [Nitrospiraceae bacterium]
MAEEVRGVHVISAGVYPKAQILNRGIAKLIDLFIVAAACQILVPVGFLGGLAYILIADGFSGGRSIGKRLIGLQTVLPGRRETAGFRDSIIRNLPFAVAQVAFAVPYVGWLISVTIIAFEAVLIIGNEQGRRFGDEVAGTQVLDVGRLASPD